MKIFLAEQVRRGDQYTIDREPISPYALMTRAAEACAQWVFEKYHNQKTTPKVLILCGSGNNGGDGLGIAKVLAEKGWSVCYTMNSAPRSEESQRSLEVLQSLESTLDLTQVDYSPLTWQDCDLYVDALLGSGISGPARGKALEGIDFLNSQSKPVISIDIPSGLSSDGDFSGPAVKADHTLVFEQPKLSFLLKGMEEYPGEFHLLPIGIHPDFTANEHSPYHYITDEEAQSWLQPEKRTAYKGTRGHVHIIGGGKDTYGAPILTALSSFRSGGGLVSVTMPENWIAESGVAHPDIMFQSGGRDYIQSFPKINTSWTYAIGPGLGQNPKTESAFLAFLQSVDQPIVLDADGINLLAKNPEHYKGLPAGSILTPHWGEVRRLIPEAAHLNGFELYSHLSQWAVNHSVNVLFKNPFTCVFTPDGHLYFNSSGTVALAVAGSGDVLTGIIARLLASGYPSDKAAILGMWIHGKAGQKAAETHSERGARALDIIQSIPKVFSR
ncbi:MAG: bifunctional ADP-dependent NAD(P)H-hydrate dehydratase/NAD(P)H-hydrate epimerase [Schleiferiaceae bacterium]